MRALWAGLAVALFAATQPGPDFRDIGKQAGLTASFPNGGDKTKAYIIETTGSGVAFIDYDNDGYLDIFVLSGDGGTNRMYHNDRIKRPDLLEKAVLSDEDQRLIQEVREELNGREKPGLAGLHRAVRERKK